MLCQGVYQPKVEYPLGNPFLNEKQVQNIESSSIPKDVAECGYNRKICFEIKGEPKELSANGFYLFKTTIGATSIL